MIREPHFLIEWHPTREIEKAARAKGWTPEGDTSLWDHVQMENFVVGVTRKTFKGAVNAARQALPFDVFGEVRVAKREPDPDSPPGRVDFDDVAVWDIRDDSKPSLDEPDFYPDR